MVTDSHAALVAYNDFRQAHPEYFVNLPDTAFEIVFDPDLQKTAGAALVYKDTYVVLLRDAVRFRNGFIGPYIRVISAADQGGAAVLPVIDGRVVLMRHERHATRKKHWEIPRGFAASGETPAETARREAVEEIGISAPEIIDIGSVYPDTGASNVHTRLYLARITGTGHVEANEGIDELKVVTADELDEMLRAEQVTDSFTLAAILQARVRGLIG
jgi:ADP-ribose pyrophosphatase